MGNPFSTVPAAARVERVDTLKVERVGHGENGNTKVVWFRDVPPLPVDRANMFVAMGAFERNPGGRNPFAAQIPDFAHFAADQTTAPPFCTLVDHDVEALPLLLLLAQPLHRVAVASRPRRACIQREDDCAQKHPHDDENHKGLIPTFDDKRPDYLMLAAIFGSLQRVTNDGSDAKPGSQ